MKQNEAKNPMRKIRVEKITLNIGAGKDEEKLKRGIALLKKITGVEPQKTMTRKRIPTWGLRPGLTIGCKFTLRGKAAEELLRRLLEAAGNKLHAGQFDREGNFSFGIVEYIDIPGVSYDPDLKMMGLEVSVTLGRAGFHVKRRKVRSHKIPARHRTTPADVMQFMQERFQTRMVQEEASS